MAAKPKLQPFIVTAPLCEDGVHYAKGDTIQTTAERAETLGYLVEKPGKDSEKSES